MAEENVETVVNDVEEIDVKIAELQQEKIKITSEYHEELLEHDLRTVKRVEAIIRNLITDKAKEIAEYHELLGIIEEITVDIEKEIRQSKGV